MAGTEIVEFLREQRRRAQQQSLEDIARVQTLAGFNTRSIFKMAAGKTHPELKEEVLDVLERSRVEP